jgi:hypothetical protein
MGLKAGFDCLDHGQVPADQVHLVWVTRHGEITVTIELLKELAEDELLMPMAFSNSVPNTPPAYFDIATDNTLITRTVCGGRDSFHKGLLDAVGLLLDKQDHPVLLIQADGVLPEPLDEYNTSGSLPFGMALLLDEDSDDGDAVSVTRRSTESPQSAELPPGLILLRWLIGDRESIRLHSGRMNWIWERS